MMICCGGIIRRFQQAAVEAAAVLNAIPRKIDPLFRLDRQQGARVQATSSNGASRDEVAFICIICQVR